MKCKPAQFTKILVNHIDLSKRLKHSEEFLKEVQAGASDLLIDTWDHVAIFAAGSLGRFETGRKSDLDVFLIGGATSNGATLQVTRLEEIQLFAHLIKMNEKLKLPPFSGDGRFLKVHALDSIITSTGDAHDDSENFFTTRLLLLLESKAIWNEEMRDMALKSVLENYFKDGKGKKDFRPLFLLNDLLRYWRTLCLNYERDRVESSKWWKKNLNLKFSRKLTVFSTVLAIVVGLVKTQDDVRELADLVPLQRLALGLDALGDNNLEDGFRLFLNDYESFLAAKSHEELDATIPTEDVKEEFRLKADRFGDFLHELLASSKIDPTLRKFLLI